MTQNKLTIYVGLRWKRFLAVLLLIIYQVFGQLILSTQITRSAEEVCISRLGEAAHEFNAHFYEHAMSDREQLRVVADMLATLINEGEHDLSVHLAAFEQRGMLNWLQVLMPDNMLITGSGTYDVSAKCSYAAELGSVPCISNISSGYVDASKHVIRSSVPIISNNETIAILYGVYDLGAGTVPAGTSAFGGKCYTFIMEADSGLYLLDNLHNNSLTAGNNSTYVAKPGYDLALLEADLAACREGYSAFRSQTMDDYMYIYYSPIGINNWMTMISVPEKTALDYAHSSRNMMVASVVYISLGVIVYFLALYRADQKLQHKNQFVKSIQSKLLEVYHKPEYYQESLKALAARARCDALIVVDETLPEAEAVVGSRKELVDACTQLKEQLGEDLLSLCRQHRKNVTLHASSALLQSSPRLHRFIEQHKLTKIALSPVMSADGFIHQCLAAFEPRNPDTLVLLNTLSVDLLMAASNIDHMTSMEIASTVDGLTKIMNRACYHKRLAQFSARTPQGLGCVYIDVNDLHAINNRYGHEKGDAMLVTIASALADAYGQKNVFRFGGDEFVVLMENVTEEWMNQRLTEAVTRVTDEGYTMSTGMEWVSQATDVSAVIREAESKMYKDKYRFYQEKEQKAALPSLEHKAVRRLLTENADVNAFLDVAENHYRGVYFVNLQTDEVREIFARHYFYTALEVNDNRFSSAFKTYMAETVDKQSRRSMQNFFNYEQINDHLLQQRSPTVEYTKSGGERMRLTVHRSPQYTETFQETLWVFEIVR